jgi:hypothetical protein
MFLSLVPPQIARAVIIWSVRKQIKTDDIVRFKIILYFYVYFTKQERQFENGLQPNIIELSLCMGQPLMTLILIFQNVVIRSIMIQKTKMYKR